MTLLRLQDEVCSSAHSSCPTTDRKKTRLSMADSHLEQASKFLFAYQSSHREGRKESVVVVVVVVVVVATS